MDTEIIATPPFREVVFRADNTGATQLQLGDRFQWQGKDPLQWAPDTAAVRAQRKVLDGAKISLKDIGIDLQELLDRLHDATAQGLGMARGPSIAGTMPCCGC